MNLNKEKVNRTTKKHRALRIIGRVILALVLLVLLLLLVIRSERGQQIIVKEVSTYISAKTNTHVELERLFVSFDGNIVIEELFLDDPSGDTLVYSKYLEVEAPLWPIIRGKGIGVDFIESRGLRANIKRTDSVNGFNFQFLIDAFDTQTNAEPEANSVTTSKEIIIGLMAFTNANIVYEDAVTGIESRFIIGNLKIAMEAFDLENMEFKAREGSIENTFIEYTEYPVSKVINTQEASLPLLAIKNLNIKNVNGFYNLTESGLYVDFQVPEMHIEIPSINLSKNAFDLGTIKVDGVVLGIAQEEAQDENGLLQKDPKLNTSFWPGYCVNIDALDISDTAITYTLNKTIVEQGIFNPAALSLKALEVNATNVFLKDKTAGIQIENVSGDEASGLSLRKFAGNYLFTESKIEGKSVELSLNQSKILGDFEVSYNSLQEIINNPTSVNVALDFPFVVLDVNNVMYFQPSLSSNTYVKSLSKSSINASIIAAGALSKVNIEALQLHWSDTHISGSGLVQDLNTPQLLSATLPDFTVTSKRSDLIKFIEEPELSIKLPDSLRLKGSLQKNRNTITTNVVLETDQGKASLQGDFKTGASLSLDSDIQFTKYDLGDLLKNKQLGKLTGSISVKGAGNTINALNAVVISKIDSFTVNNYKIKDLGINGTIKNGQGTITSAYKDKNIDFVLDTDIKLDSIAPEIKTKLEIIGANLQTLGLMQREVRTAVNINAFFKGNTTDYTSSVQLSNGVVVYNNETYRLGSLDSKVRVRPDTTSISVKSNLVNLQLESNADPVRIRTGLQEYITRYFYQDSTLLDTNIKPVNLKMRGAIAKTPLLSEVFLVNIKDLDTIDVRLDFEQKKRKLSASIQAPHINYSGYELHNLDFKMSADVDNFDFRFGLKTMSAGPLAIGKTEIKGHLENKELALDFLAYDNEEKLIHISSGITSTSDGIRLYVDPKELILNRKPWTIPPTNEIIINDKNLIFNDFRLKRNSQEARFTSSLPSFNKSHFGIVFENFKLQGILAYLNPDKQLATGILNGNFIVEEPFGNTGLIADLQIENLGVIDVKMGTLNFNAQSLETNQYDFNLEIGGGVVDLELFGDYVSDVNGANLNMDLSISEFHMAALESFSQGEIKKASGTFSGDFTINGTLEDPVYDGQLRFKNAGFNIARLNAGFTLPDEYIDIDNNGISVDALTIKDEKGNSLIASGSIGTEFFINPTFDLNIKAQNFQALNATEDDNDLIYGTAIINAQASIKGDLDIPIVNVTGNVTEDTDLTYVMPQSTEDIESREGIVIFVNRENPDSILTSNEEESSAVTGFNIKALLKVVDGAKVKIILDPETGDMVEVQGKGEFNFTLLPNGLMGLTGVYEMSKGKYTMSLYNLVSRSFDISSGSRISWSGDPFNATLDVRAIYNLETSAASLMAPASSALDPSSRGRFRQVLPFMVYLDVNGELLSPQLTFGLDMPEDEQGALGGQVYSRVQQVNTQESELNRQVFSLLVLNRFYPNSGSDGSNGGFATMARNNINDALSEQLNVFADKLLGKTGINVDFGLDSYTDYQGDAPKERTQLEIAAQKKLLNDRLIVTVGSSVDVQGESTTDDNSPLLGTVSLEYMLTNDGRYRVKGFRRNEFDNVIDGQTIVSGIGLIFTEEFNKFSELWDAILKSKTKQLRQEEEKLKKIEEKTSND